MKDLYFIQAGHRFGLYVDASENGLGARLYQYKSRELERRKTQEQNIATMVEQKEKKTL